MKKNIVLSLSCALLFATSVFCRGSMVNDIPSNSKSTTIHYSVPEKQWEEEFGNHRAIIKVDKPSDAVSIDFLWRRHDISPEKRQMLIVNAETGEKITNVFRVSIDKEQCKLVFGPLIKRKLLLLLPSLYS